MKRKLVGCCPTPAFAHSVASDHNFPRFLPFSPSELYFESQLVLMLGEDAVPAPAIDAFFLVGRTVSSFCPDRITD